MIVCVEKYEESQAVAGRFLENPLTRSHCDGTNKTTNLSRQRVRKSKQDGNLYNLRCKHLRPKHYVLWP